MAITLSVLAIEARNIIKVKEFYKDKKKAMFFFSNDQIKKITL